MPDQSSGFRGRISSLERCEWQDDHATYRVSGEDLVPSGLHRGWKATRSHRFVGLPADSRQSRTGKHRESREETSGGCRRNLYRGTGEESGSGLPELMTTFPQCGRFRVPIIPRRDDLRGRIFGPGRPGANGRSGGGPTSFGGGPTSFGGGIDELRGRVGRASGEGSASFGGGTDELRGRIWYPKSLPTLSFSPGN